MGAALVDQNDDFNRLFYHHLNDVTEFELHGCSTHAIYESHQKQACKILPQPVTDFLFRTQSWLFLELLPCLVLPPRVAVGREIDDILEIAYLNRIFTAEKCINLG